MALVKVQSQEVTGQQRKQELCYLTRLWELVIVY